MSLNPPPATASKKRKHYMLPSELTGSFSSKDSFYTYLRDQLQYFLPPYEAMTTAWLKDILRGDRQLLKASEVRLCNPPRFDEVSVRNLYADCLKLDGMAAYFPQKFAKGKSCPREYFFSILSTLHPEYTDEMIKKSKALRNAPESESQANERIEISEEWAERLKEFPQANRSRGKMLMLLKSKSKVGVAQKPRKKHEALHPSKRLKVSEADGSFSVRSHAPSQQSERSETTIKKIVPTVLSTFEKKEDD